MTVLLLDEYELLIDLRHCLFSVLTNTNIHNCTKEYLYTFLKLFS